MISLCLGLLCMFNSAFNLSQLDGKRVGYYIGSFDPIHIGHQKVVEEALKHVDYVLIYPAPGGDEYKNRTDWAIRLKMIESVYGTHEKVLVTHLTPKELQDKWGAREVVGIIGSDTVIDSLLGDNAEKYQSVFMRGLPLKEKHYMHTIGMLMALKCSEFLVALRDEDDLTHLDGKIGDRTITGFISVRGGFSSTKVRKAVKNGESIADLVSPEVDAIICEKKLYR